MVANPPALLPPARQAFHLPGPVPELPGVLHGAGRAGTGPGRHGERTGPEHGLPTPTHLCAAVGLRGRPAGSPLPATGESERSE